jgi:nucleotide-binding universal stress UspA family protein
MKILLAVDDSTYSEEAVASVKARPWPPDTLVRVLSAVDKVPPPAADLWYDMQGHLERLQEEQVNQAEKITRNAVAALQAACLMAEPLIREGDPRSVIVDEAKEWGADLIVLGSHGYTGLKRWLLGSVAQSVISHAPCSVEIIRAKSAPTAE